MKKILSLILGLTMVTMTAFAALTADVTPNSELVFTGAAGEGGTWSQEPEKGLNKDNYTITNQTWTKGRDMVASVTFNNDADELVVTLKKDFKSYKTKELEGTIKIRDKKSSTTTYTLTIDVEVGYNQETIQITDRDNATLSTGDIDNDAIYKAVDEGSTYGDLMMDVDNLINITARVYKGEIFYFGYNTVPDKSILTANADNTGIIDVINFDGTPTFTGSATLLFYVEKGTHIYTYSGSKLTKIAATWDDNEGAYRYRTRNLTTFVFSEDPLKNAGTTEGGTGTTNPDTGANDIIGIAAALAAVSLISAAAVSMKKN